MCSSANAELVRGAGATRVVDYNDPEAMAALRAEGPRFDVVYDVATGRG